MKLAFLFAGQGSQKVGMGADLYHHFPEVKALYDQTQCEFDLEEISFNGPDTQLNQTKYAQASILMVSYAIAKVLECEGIVPDVVAGLSLGEYSALTYAQSMTLQEGIDITTKRGQLMQQALPLNSTGMAAVIGGDVDLIEKILDSLADQGCCEIANYNCPGQIVITGDLSTLALATERLKEAGIRRIIPLNVSGAFHSSLLDNASLQLKEVLEMYTLKTPTIPVVYNVSGGYSDEPVVDLLVNQIKSSVRFWQSIETMIADGVDTFIEIGPGTALKGFVRKINTEVEVYSVSDLVSLNEVLGAKQWKEK